MFCSKEEVEALRAKYIKGTRLELVSMDDPYTTLESGDKGTVMGVDDAGQIMMSWDKGSSLSLIPGEDRFTFASELQNEDDEDMEL